MLSRWFLSQSNQCNTVLCGIGGGLGRGLVSRRFEYAALCAKKFLPVGLAVLLYVYSTVTRIIL